MKYIEVQTMVKEIAKYAKLQYINKQRDTPQKRKIKNKYINRIGLELAGYFKYFQEGCVQLMDNREITYLLSKSAKTQYRIISKFVTQDIPCLVITSNLKLPGRILEIFSRHRVPVFRTRLSYENFYQILRMYLEFKFAPSKVISGVLMDIYGVGILLTGSSGIGKSECAFDLIDRKHRLIADDAVLVKRRENMVIGYPVESPLKYNIELRGIGFIDIKSLFGISSIRIRKRIELIINLVDLKKNRSMDRTGLKQEYFKILSVELPMINVPVTPGKNVAKIAELIAIKYLSEIMGLETSKQLDLKIKRFLKSKKNKTTKPLFMDDFE